MRYSRIVEKGFAKVFGFRIQLSCFHSFPRTLLQIVIQAQKFSQPSDIITTFRCVPSVSTLAVFNRTGENQEGIPSSMVKFLCACLFTMRQ
jgi:hypothetical protein